MSQMNSEKNFYNTALSAQQLCLAGLLFKGELSARQLKV